MDDRDSGKYMLTLMHVMVLYNVATFIENEMTRILVWIQLLIHLNDWLNPFPFHLRFILAPERKDFLSVYRISFWVGWQFDRNDNILFIELAFDRFSLSLDRTILSPFLQLLS